MKRAILLARTLVARALVARALLALPLLAPLGGAGGCATTPEGGPRTLASIDVQSEAGAPGSLGAHLGKVVVLDICAAWSDPCLLNARAADFACKAACGDDVEVVTMLLDEPGGPALASYRDVLDVSQRLVLPGPTTRAGRSALGDVTGIPRLVIFDREGRVVEDVTGGVASGPGIVRRLEGLLGRSLRAP